MIIQARKETVDLDMIMWICGLVHTITPVLYVGTGISGTGNFIFIAEIIDRGSEILFRFVRILLQLFFFWLMGIWTGVFTDAQLLYFVLSM